MGLHYYSAFSLRLQLKPAHKHIVVLLAYSALLLCSEWLYRYFFNIPIATKPLESFGFILLIVGLFYFARYRITQIFIFGFFALNNNGIFLPLAFIIGLGIVPIGVLFSKLLK